MAARDSAEQAKDVQQQAAAQSVKRLDNEKQYLSKCAQRLESQTFALMLALRHLVSQHEACQRADAVNFRCSAIQITSDAVAMLLQIFRKPWAI